MIYAVALNRKGAFHLRGGHGHLQSVERSVLRDLPRGSQKTAPRCSRQCAADADSANSDARERGHRRKATADQDVHRLGCNGLHDRCYVVDRAKTGGEEAVGTRVRICR